MAAPLKKKLSLSEKLSEKLRNLTTSSASYAEPISDGSDDDTFRREKKTRAKYPLSLDLTDAKYAEAKINEKSLSFIGAGLRSEGLMGIEFWIYSIGLYTELSKTKKALLKYAGEEPGTLQDNEDFCKDLIGMTSVTRVLRFVITLAGLTAGLVVAQFDKVLLPKMKAKGKEDNYKIIVDQIGKAKLKKGTIMLLTLSADGTVACICDGELLGTVTCKVLSESIMDIYFGDKPVSKDVKEKVCDGLHAALKSEQ